jgi:hypothetical protein
MSDAYEAGNFLLGLPPFAHLNRVEMDTNVGNGMLHFSVDSGFFVPALRGLLWVGEPHT